MSASATSPYIPPGALTVWADRDRIYVAYPAANQGADFIVDYPRDTRGLHMVIDHLVKSYEAANPLPHTKTQVSAPTIRAAPGVRKHKAPATKSSNLTDSDRASALAALIEAGVLPRTAGN